MLLIILIEIIYITIYDTGNFNKYSGRVFGNIELQHEYYRFILYGKNQGQKSAGKWGLDVTYDNDILTVTKFACVVDDLTLNEDTFNGHEQATTLYYNADAEIVNTDADAAVIVKRDDTSTTGSYTVTVKSTLSSSLIIDGVTAEVTDINNTGTMYKVKNGPTPNPTTVTKSCFTT